MTWEETLIEIQELISKFAPYHEIKEKDLNLIQKAELKALRDRAIELHYIRIGIVINENSKPLEKSSR